MRTKLLTRRATALAAFALVTLAMVEPAAAQSTGLEPLEKAVNFLVDFLTGPFGRAIAILAFIVLGFLALMGRITYIMAGLACLGIGLIFGAPQIVDSLVSAVGG